jgi:hypothetical protein
VRLVAKRVLDESNLKRLIDLGGAREVRGRVQERRGVGGEVGEKRFSAAARRNKGRR